MKKNRTTCILNRKHLFMIGFCLVLFVKLKSQIGFQTDYQIKNNTNLSVAIDFTVSCNKGTTNNEGKLIFIRAGETYLVPAPYFNQARTFSDCDIIIQLAGIFGGEPVSRSHQTSRYNDSMGLFNGQNNLKPQGVIIWGPLITNIW